MLKWFEKHPVLYISLAIILVAAILLGVTASSNKLNPDSILGKGVFAVEEFLTSVGEGIKDVFSYKARKAEIAELTRENALLKEELSENAINEQRLSELKKLSEYLNYINTDEKYDVVTCDVISADYSSASNIFTINRGTESGIENGDIVVVKEGLVGRITETGDGYSIVSTMLSDKTKISFKLTANNDSSGIVYGTSSGTIKGYMMNSQYTVSKGDSIVTSGIGDIPYGIEVGIVTDVFFNSSLVKEIVVESSVDFNALSLVMVLV